MFIFKSQTFFLIFSHIVYFIGFSCGTQTVKLVWHCLRRLHTCSQRPSGLAQAGGTILFMRATNVHVPTAFSSRLLLLLRKTPRWRQVGENAVDNVRLEKGVQPDISGQNRKELKINDKWTIKHKSSRK